MGQKRRRKSVKFRVVRRQCKSRRLLSWKTKRGTPLPRANRATGLSRSTPGDEGLLCVKLSPHLWVLTQRRMQEPDDDHYEPSWYTCTRP
jgi:hypothetical protein